VVVVDALNTAHTPAAAVLDHAVLDALGQLRGKWQPEFVDRVITMFMETALTLLTALKNGSAKNDCAALHHASHSLKSCSATIGAYPLAARCENLELLARASSVADAPARVDAIAQEYRLLEAALISRLAQPKRRSELAQRSAGQLPGQFRDYGSGG